MKVIPACLPCIAFIANKRPNHVALAIYKLYGSSTTTAIMTEYPHHSWKAWAFANSPKHWFADLSMLFRNGDPVSDAIARIYLEELAAKYSIHRQSDWSGLDLLQVNPTQHRQMEHFGGIMNLINRLYPTDENLAKINDKHTNGVNATLGSAEQIFDPKTRREVLDQIVARLPISPNEANSIERLYTVQKSTFLENGGASFFLSLQCCA